MDLTVRVGNLLDADEQYICHQGNCTTTRAAHMAADVFARFPYANVYADPQTRVPGTIRISGNGKDQRLIIAMFAQVYPGSPRFVNSPLDGTLARQGYFRECLDDIIRLPNLQSIAFPWRIGCGAAGGDWLVYRHMIKEFAEQVDVPVRVYQLPA